MSPARGAPRRLIAGWLAGQIVQGTGFGIVGDLIIGIVGAFIGSWLLPQLGIHLGSGIIAAIINATIGAARAMIAKMREPDAIDLQKDPPETARIFGIISCMGSILAKTNWVRDLVGPLTNFHFYPEVSQTCHHGHIKIRYRLRGET